MKLLAVSLAVLSAGSVTLAQPGQNIQQINTDRVVDFDVCYFELNQEDRDGDRQLTEQEYLGFAKDFGGRTECLAPLTDLPLELRLAWNSLSCECANRGGGPDCCKGTGARIPTQGALVDSTTGTPDAPVVGEQLFLEQVCLRTDQAIIAFCGPLPPPAIPPLPPALVTTAAGAPPGATGLSPGEIAAIATAATILLILLCCCRRRRWILCAGKDYDSDESSSSSSDPSDDGASREEGGTRAIDVEEPMTEDEPPAMASRSVEQEMSPDDPDDPDLEGGAGTGKMKAAGDEEDEDDGAKRWGRHLQDAEYEDEVDPFRRGPIDQLPPPEDPDAGLNLRHVERPPPPEDPEDPYALEHYVPDGGVHDPQRNWEGGYEADGGWTPEEREGRAPTEFNHKKYEREAKEEPEVVDNRKQRHIEALGAGEVFDQLEGSDEESAAAPNDMFDWVIRSTLNTLDQKGDQLAATQHERPAAASSIPEATVEEPGPSFDNADDQGDDAGGEGDNDDDKEDDDIKSVV